MIIENFNRVKIIDNNNSKSGVITRTEKMIKIQCDLCGRIHSRLLKHYNKMKKNELFNMDYCNMCWRLILNNRPEKIEKMRSGLIKVWSSNEKRNEMSILIKNKCKKTGYMIGDNNPMKNYNVRKKVGVTRSKNMTDEEKQKYSEGTKRAWIEGKFLGVNNTWKCLWYDYKHTNGKIYKVQGTWELKFIEWLDKNNMGFKCHQDRIPYVDKNGKEKNYYPDFFVYEWNSYVDIKSDYVYNNQKEKFEILLKQNNNIKILFKKDLENLNIKI